MKLKEKLALDAALDMEFVDPIKEKSYREGYLAGFEKAREMAIDTEYPLSELGEEEVTK